MRVTADYETRSRVELKKTGAYKYAIDPSTEPLCLAWRYAGDPKKYLWHPAFPNARCKTKTWINAEGKRIRGLPAHLLPYADGMPEEGRADLDELSFRIQMGEVTEIEAHNAMFERLITTYVMPRWAPLVVDPKLWRCSAAVAASFSLPRHLDGATKALDLGEKKDAAGKALIKKLCSPSERLGGKFCEEVESLLELFDYCKQDVVAEEELAANLRPLIPIELATWQLDQEINLRGVCFDRPLVNRALEIVESEQANADLEVDCLTDGAVKGTAKRDDLMKWLTAEGYPADNLQGTTIDEVLEPGRWELKPDVRRVLELRRSVGRTSNKKFAAIREMITEDDRARGLLMYYGANTGRWAGKGIQPHNFPRGTIKGKIDQLVEDIMTLDLESLRMIYGDPMELLASSLRGTIIATPGRTLNVADYAAIEARVTAWLSGQIDMLDLFRAGMDVYKVMAASIFQVPIEAVTPEQRQLGKAAILGLGFQMGAKKFVTTCAAAPYFITITEDFAEGVVKAYRKKNDKIVATWKDLNDCALEAIRRGPGAPPVLCGKVSWAQRGRFLHCKLPSGRVLSYCDPSIELKLVEGVRADGSAYSFIAPSIRFMGIDGKTHQWVRMFTYGGSLMENVVQATARDLMRDAMLNIEASGIYQNVLTVHDELVAESDLDKGSVHEFEKLVTATQPWAAGMPVKAEAWRGTRYRK